MAEKSNPEYIDDAKKLLELIKDDMNVVIRKRKIPWDKDIEIVDFLIDAHGDKEDEAYMDSKCKDI